MPVYKIDIEHIISAKEMEGMLDRCKKPRDRFILSLLYLTGPRPQEIVYSKEKKTGITKSDIWEEDGFIHFKIKTLKLGRSKAFKIRNRVLKVPKDTKFMNNVLAWKKKSKDEQLVKLSTQSIRNIITRVSDGTLCPYSFRHTRLTRLSETGTSANEIMFFKGARDLKSVYPYLHAKVVGEKINPKGFE